MHTAARTALAALVVLVWCSATRAAGILDQVPADAFVVIKVNNLEQTSNKIAQWAEQLGLAQLSPEFADPLGALEKNLQISKGLDRSGEMAFVFLDPEAVGGDEQDAMLVLAPTNEYKTFLTNFKDVKNVQGGISSFKSPENDKTLYVANWGNYAAVSPAKEVLAKKPGGMKLTPLAAREGNEKDILVFANMPALRETLLPMLEDARDQMLKEIEQNIQGGPAVDADVDAKDPAGADADAETADADADVEAGANAEAAKKFIPLARAMANQYMNIAKQFLTDTDGAMLGINLTDAGLNTTVAADFKKGSYLGDFASKLKNTEEPLMAGLPQRKYFVFGGMSVTPEVWQQVFRDIAEPLAEELKATDAEGNEIVASLNAAEHAIAATESYAFGYTVPTGALGADSIFQQVAVLKGDAKIIAKAQNQILTGVAKQLSAQAVEGAEVTLEHEPGSRTVNGVKLDTFRFNVEVDEEDPQTAQVQQVMAFMFGPNGIGGTSGVVDENTFVIVQGGTDKLLKDTLAAAKANKDPLSGLAPVKAVAAEMPKSRFVVEYIDLAQMVSTGVKYAQSFQLPVKLKLPANLPPIGASASTEGASLRVDVHVPTSLIQSLVAAGMQTYMELQGGDAGEPEGL